MTGFFSQDYFSARERFRSAALANAGRLESIALDAKGPAQEDLTIDIGWFGAPNPARALIHSSGVHGVEGFAGSAIQLQWLDEGLPKLRSGCAIVIVHVLNPFAMAWLRRANENNVDLNHNFLGADDAYEGAGESYRKLNSFLNPVARDWFLPRALLAAMRHGTPALRSALSVAQYEFPQGLCFGGKQREQATRRFQMYISGKLVGADRITAIDVHSGPCCAQSTLEGLYRRMFPAARVDFELQQLASCSYMRALAALRSENRQHHYLGRGSNVDLLKTFCPDSEEWRGQALAQGRTAIDDAVKSAFADGVAAN